MRHQSWRCRLGVLVGLAVIILLDPVLAADPPQGELKLLITEAARLHEQAAFSLTARIRLTTEMLNGQPAVIQTGKATFSYDGIQEPVLFETRCYGELERIDYLRNDQVDSPARKHVFREGARETTWNVPEKSALIRHTRWPDRPYHDSYSSVFRRLDYNRGKTWSELIETYPATYELISSGANTVVQATWQFDGCLLTVDFDGSQGFQPTRIVDERPNFKSLWEVAQWKSFGDGSIHLPMKSVTTFYRPAKGGEETDERSWLATRRSEHDCISLEIGDLSVDSSIFQPHFPAGVEVNDKIIGEVYVVDGPPAEVVEHITHIIKDAGLPQAETAPRSADIGKSETETENVENSTGMRFVFATPRLALYVAAVVVCGFLVGVIMVCARRKRVAKQKEEQCPPIASADN